MYHCYINLLDVVDHSVVGPLPGHYVILTDLATLLGLENVPSVKEVGQAFKKNGKHQVKTSETDQSNSNGD